MNNYFVYYLAFFILYDHVLKFGGNGTIELKGKERNRVMIGAEKGAQRIDLKIFY